jgi:hypothetical protein
VSKDTIYYNSPAGLIEITATGETMNISPAKGKDLI